jgi:predicted ester cyclase
MSTPTLVETFYSRIWNDGDLTATRALLSTQFRFRGSLGLETQGRDAFENYVRSVRSALTPYHCEILECVAEGNNAFAKMHFSGVHVAPFRGFQPTGKPVQWLGAALFEFEHDRIASLWVLGDLAGLDAVLQANSTAGARQTGTCGGSTPKLAHAAISCTLQSSPQTAN